MKNLNKLGLIFYIVTIAGYGLQTLYFRRLPYILIQPLHYRPLWLVLLIGVVLVLVAVGLLFDRIIKQTAITLGILFTLIFICFYLPYQLFVSTDHLQLGDWENAEKELAFAGGAFIISSFFITGSQKRAVTCLGICLFFIPMISFGILHFMMGPQAATLVPAWIPGPLIWTYLGGAGLIGCSLAIILNIKRQLFATILGAIMLIWFVILHIPRVIAAPDIYLASEITSALMALGYSGIALMLTDMLPNTNFANKTYR